MKEIESTRNETYKHLKQLSTSSKYRRRTGQTLLEGIHLSQSYLLANRMPEMLVLTEAALRNDEAAEIARRCDVLGVPAIVLSEINFKAISSVEHGVGVMLVIDMPTEPTAGKVAGNALLLEDIQDPGNMGVILRTAAAAGFTHIFASSGCVSVWSPKVLRAGMGAHFAIKVHENCDLDELISHAAVLIYATSLAAHETIYQKDLSRPAAWLFGNEGQGVSAQLMKLNVQPVVIPQNPAVESLNVAASVAVCLFEHARQQSQ